VVPLLAFGFSLVLLALVPGLRRLPVVLLFAGSFVALVVWAATSDAFLAAAAGLVPFLVGLLAMEIADTLHLVSAPTRAARRVRRAEREEEERLQVQRERERARRRRERERERDRLAA
jgi:uncharacterized membrane protein YccC